MSNIAVIGSGTWGTALAQVADDNGHHVIIYGHNPNQVNDINNNHKNSFYFGDDISLSPSITATTDLSFAIKDADIILMAVPSAALRSVLTEINGLLDHPAVFINTAKGFDTEKNQRLSFVFKGVIDPDKLKGFVSLIGPSHAEEVIVRDTTCICAVSLDEEASKFIAKTFSNTYFRVYLNNDEVGSEIGVAMKNAIALASGILEGLGFGDNARAALCTRGLAEIVRFGVSQGGKPETYLGLTGLGDLVVTCYSFHSRNFSAGLQIGKDDGAKHFMETNTKTVEGIRTVKVIFEMALAAGVELPIINALYAVLYGGTKPSELVTTLMSRPLKKEGK
ncbi:MAG: NAD(P)-dependent glycerol-3-phosphate dehydrogenase [Erysipelotrichaceae bacterium]|nr:NAD(P)-dependent glycerol-3-phosphate dehydrogenase [Erysipelotrichaceae bacterium]